MRLFPFFRVLDFFFFSLFFFFLAGFEVPARLRPVWPERTLRISGPSAGLAHDPARASSITDPGRLMGLPSPAHSGDRAEFDQLDGVAILLHALLTTGMSADTYVRP